MAQLSAADIKPHLVLPADDTGDDILIQGYIDAAELAVENYLRRDMAADFPSGWPADILQAVKFLVGHFYLNREAVASSRAGSMPFGVQFMLAPYRNMEG